MASRKRDRTAVEGRPPRRDVTDPRALRALAHPLRLRILGELIAEGPATSTTLAGTLGVSTGVTSYHLRLLARHGFVEEDPERGTGRERWWRHVPTDLRWGRSDAVEGEREASDELRRLSLERDLRLLLDHLAGRHRDPEWFDASMISSSTTQLTVDELKDLGERYLEWVGELGRSAEERPAGARPVKITFWAFPYPERRDEGS